MEPQHTDQPCTENFGMVGGSAAIQHLLQKIHRLSDNELPVLITGESGVGKELVAHALHRSSRLRDEVFLPVNAASLGGSLMESELFGYQKGAFTGASESKNGLVKAADGGTLFLDEIGELPVDVQAKLLRLLQEGEIRPIGAVKPQRVNVRIVAATNRDLEVEVKEHRFRKDLYFRLNVVTLRIPPLRERREDIPSLVDVFLQRYARRHVVISSEVMEALMAYDWPGNVRELENTIRRLVALKSNPRVRFEDLPSPLLNNAEAHRPSPDEMLPLAEVERRHILRVLEFTKGDVTTAAHLLGVGRTTLYRRLKEYRALESDFEFEDVGAPNVESPPAHRWIF